MADALTERYRDLLDDCYDCVDRIVLNAYNTLCDSAGGFRHWWRRLMNGSDKELDNTHLMRLSRVPGLRFLTGAFGYAVIRFSLTFLRQEATVACGLQEAQVLAVVTGAVVMAQS